MGLASSEVLGLARFQGLLGWGFAFSSILFFLLSLHISMGPGRFPVLRIGSDPAEVSGSGRTGGESDSLAMVVHRGVPREPPFPLGKGKGKISEIRYPSGFEYLRAAIQNVDALGLSQVEPLYGEIFATRYGSPLGVQGFGALM